MITRREQRIPLATAARQSRLTPHGLLKILRRTGKAIRDDGHWYADPAVVEQIVGARRVLGLYEKMQQTGVSHE
jgi:hypothetical protein